MDTILSPGFSSSQSVGTGLWDLGAYAGTLAFFRQPGPAQKVAYFGATTIIDGLYPVFQNPQNTNATFLVTAGFDPVVVAALQVILRSTGQIWPVGFS